MIDKIKLDGLDDEIITKLNSIEAPLYKGVFESGDALKAKYPTSVLGAYGFVMLSDGTTHTWVWSDSANTWVDDGETGSTETPQSIAEKYESISNVVRFTPTLENKVNSALPDAKTYTDTEVNKLTDTNKTYTDTVVGDAVERLNIDVASKVSKDGDAAISGSLMV